MDAYLFVECSQVAWYRGTALGGARAVGADEPGEAADERTDDTFKPRPHDSFVEMHDYLAGKTAHGNAGSSSVM